MKKHKHEPRSLRLATERVRSLDSAELTAATGGRSFNCTYIDVPLDPPGGQLA